MPKSRRRPAAVRKLAASRRRHQGHGRSREDTEHGFMEAPWLAWQHARDSAVPPDALAVLEHTPFRLAGAEDAPTATVTLAGMLSEFDGEMAELVSSYRLLADHGLLAWDRKSNTVVRSIPADAG